MYLPPGILMADCQAKISGSCSEILVLQNALKNDVLKMTL
jgi:hypothetical protein